MPSLSPGAFDAVRRRDVSAVHEGRTAGCHPVPDGKGGRGARLRRRSCLRSTQREGPVPRRYRGDGQDRAPLARAGGWGGALAGNLPGFTRGRVDAEPSRLHDGDRAVQTDGADDGPAPARRHSPPGRRDARGARPSGKSVDPPTRTDAGTGGAAGGRAALAEETARGGGRSVGTRSLSRRRYLTGLSNAASPSSVSAKAHQICTLATSGT